MPMSKSLNSYGDVVQVLTAARERGGVVHYRLPSLGAAVAWRARAYFYRKLLTENAIKRAGSVRGFVPTTEWDDMLLETDGKGGVKISFGRVRGVLTDEQGLSFDPAPIRVQKGEAEEILANTQPTPMDATEANILGDLEEAARAMIEKNS